MVPALAEDVPGTREQLVHPAGHRHGEERHHKHGVDALNETLRLLGDDLIQAADSGLEQHGGNACNQTAEEQGSLFIILLLQKQTTCVKLRLKLLLTLQAEAIELAGDVGDKALGASAKAELGDEVADHAVEGLVIGFHGLRAQHVLPQEAPDGLPLLPLAGNKTGNDISN